VPDDLLVDRVLLLEFFREWSLTRDGFSAGIDSGSDVPRRIDEMVRRLMASTRSTDGRPMLFFDL
jgi:hypothetical protein